MEDSKQDFVTCSCGIVTINNMVLSDEHPNIIYVPIGRMPPGKAQTYLAEVLNKIKSFGEQYKVILIAVHEPSIQYPFSVKGEDDSKN